MTLSGLGYRNGRQGAGSGGLDHYPCCYSRVVIWRVSRVNARGVCYGTIGRTRESGDWVPISRARIINAGNAMRSGRVSTRRKGDTKQWEEQG